MRALAIARQRDGFDDCVGGRQFGPYLLAATADDAYNALVCTRFAPELGRERVYQLVPDDADTPNEAAREWRGKIAIGNDMQHARLAELMAAGAAIVVDQPDEAIVPVPTSNDKSWSLAVIAANGGYFLWS